jgi:hypothetical protein
MSKRTIRILILVATASAALLVVAAPGIARRGGDDDHRDRIRGTIASFTDGVLTIRQRNGDDVEGKVNRRTEIECERHRSSTAVAAHDGDDDHGGRDDDGDGDDHGGRGRDHAEDDGDDHHRGRHHDRRRCSARLLTAGRVVREADLLSTSSGPVFREVEIIR